MKYPIHGTILRIVANLLTTRIFPVVFLFRKNRDSEMKPKIIIIGAILCTITTTGAHAVTKCVALNDSTTCISSPTQYQYHTDWAAICTTNGVSIPISGIGICSSTQGAGYQTATELDTSTTSDDNRHCWCKMTSPAVSRWVFTASAPSAGACAQSCTAACATHVQGVASCRSVMFSSLSD